MVNGSASALLTIKTSPARNVTQPTLGLNYSSGGGNGPFGLGWQLSGVSSITRKTDKGLPKYKDSGNDLESDVYLLSGTEDLVPVFKADASGAIVRDTAGNPIIDEAVQNGYLVRRYMPRTEGTFVKVERFLNVTDATEIYWRTISPLNVTTIFGGSANSRVFDPLSTAGRTERIMTWLVSEAYDTLGDAVIFNYKAENSDNVNTPRSLQASEAQRTNASRSAQRYIKTINYGNKLPNRSPADWNPFSAFTLPQDTWMFTVLFDYGEHDAVNPGLDDMGLWLARSDAFSTYRAGFEIRTYRLCQRVLMYHHFTELDPAGNPTLVSSMNLSYMDNPVATYLTGATYLGYVLDATGTPTIQKSLPPMTYAYSTFPSDESLAQLTAKDVSLESVENLPYFDGSTYQWLDLDGDGLLGVFTEQAEGWFYKQNLSANNKSSEGSISSAGPVTPKLGPLDRLSSRPAHTSRGSSHFGDVTGAGKLDLITTDQGCWGYYERTENGWGSFIQFASFPNMPFDSAGVKFVDLTGDGLPDIFICADQVFYFYPLQGALGYGHGEAVGQISDEEQSPTWVFSDVEATIYLADMSGDGLSDLVRIKQTGGVCYWPNLGYGKFGPMVEMDNPPFFDRQDIFNESRIHLADVDGSGTTDVVYLGVNGPVLFANQSGNSFSDGKRLGSFLPIDNFSSVTTVDFLGNGTICLVWSSTLPTDSNRSMKYLDVMGGSKPHLLIKIQNNLGKETRITYAPSTKFFLDDKQNGSPWITRLPFPVQCVEKQEILDQISGNKFTKRFHFSHGYFDGVEREFRGFARVDSWDTEDFSTMEPPSTSLPSTWNAPPAKVRTWYHTGAYLGGRSLEDALASEYYGASSTTSPTTSPKLHVLKDNVVLSAVSLAGNEFRESHRAMKGQMVCVFMIPTPPHTTIS